MRTKLIVIVLVMALVITASVVSAQRTGMGKTRPGAGHGQMAGMGWQQIAKALNLTADQTAQLKALHQQFVTDTQVARDQLKQKATELADLWAMEPPDAAAIKAKMAEMDPLRLEMRETGIDYMIKARDVLTPEQRTKMKTMMKGWMSKTHAMGCGWCMGPSCAVGGK